MTLDLFSALQPQNEKLCDGAFLLRRFALPYELELLTAIEHVIARAPLQNMVTPGGLPMSVQTSSCGAAGWVSDDYGYRYARRNGNQPWPAIPDVFLSLALSAAAEAGFAGFTPDSCLINCYQPGAKMSLHQDKNEKDFNQPIVSVSLGLPATFLLGGMSRSDKALRIPLIHGDVMVWGGPSRLRFHGVLPVKAASHSTVGERRINLTLRKAL